MTVNIIHIEDMLEEATTGTRVPISSLPTEAGIETGDIDYFLEPAPLPPWTKRHVPKGGDHCTFRCRFRGDQERMTLRDADNLLMKDRYLHRHDWMAVGNGTVTFAEVKSPWVKYATDNYLHMGAIHMPVMIYPTSYATTNFDWMASDPVALSDWFNSYADPLEGYEQYSAPDWDGYGASPVSGQTIASARAILKALPKTFGDPECSPGADGSIGFEWVLDQGPLRKLFIDIGPGRTWKAYWRLANGRTGNIPRKSVSLSTMTELTHLFAMLAR